MASNEDPRKTVLITGCSAGGIGHSLALSFQSRGLRVFATAPSTSSLTTLANLGVETIPLNVNDEASIQQCVAHIQTLTADRGLNYLVNNAGVNYTVPALDIDLSEAKAMFDTNVFAIMRLVQVFSPLLIEAKGTIVMIGSLAGVMPYVFGSVYNAGKAALHAYANTLRVELAPLGVSVITVVTGGVKSNLARTERSLPKDSYYAEVAGEYAARQKHAQSLGMSNSDYAESVVRQVMEGGGPVPWRWFMADARKRWVWEGGKSSLVWLMASGWTWHGLWDWYFTRTFRLDKLRGMGQGKKVK